MNNIQRWQHGLLGGEIEFWRLFKTYHPKTFQHGMDTTAPLDVDVDDALAKTDQNPAMILDVGSGMISSLGYTSRFGRTVSITYADPLGAVFEQIASQQGFSLPIQHQRICAEDLTTCYANNTFAVVYSRNAIDHCHDPATALRMMASLVMPGGSLVLKHYENCANINNHDGLHQWNFYEDNGALYLQGEESPMCVGKLVSPCEQVAVERYREWWGHNELSLVKAIYRKPE